MQHNGECLGMGSNGRYMFDCLREKAEIAGDRVFNIGRGLCQKVFGEDADDYALAQVDVHSQVGFLVYFILIIFTYNVT